MPQKGQITKHEWRIKTANRVIHSWTCELCECKKVKQLIMQGHTYYYEKGTDISTTTKPPCITRKIETNGDEKCECNPEAKRDHNCTWCK